MTTCWDGKSSTYGDLQKLKALAESYKKEVEALHDKAGPDPDAPAGTTYTFDWSRTGVDEKPRTGEIWESIWPWNNNEIGDAAGAHQTTLDDLEKVKEVIDLLDGFVKEDNISDTNQEFLDKEIKEWSDEYGSSFKCDVDPNAVSKKAGVDYQDYLQAAIEENNPEVLDVKINDLTEEQTQQLIADNADKCADAVTAASILGTGAEDLLSPECKEYKTALDNVGKFEDLKAAVADVLTSGAEKDSIMFKEQCFLLAHVVPLAKIKEALDEASTSKMKKLPYETSGAGNACLLAQGDPFAFINKLTQNVGTDGGSTKEAFFDMKTSQLSSLQPMIRLFKVVVDENGIESQVEIKFDSFYTSRANPGATSPASVFVDNDRGGTYHSVYDLEDFLTVKTRRGHGVGIKSFNISYEADNPFAIKKSIKAKLVLHANTFDELLKNRGGYTYADLALKTGGADGAGAHPGCVGVTSNQLNPLNHNVSTATDTKLNFRLKAIVGWARPGTHELISEGSALKTAIDDSCISINLTPTIHEFNIDEQGRVEFILNYLAYVEDFFDQPIFNIFSDPNITVKQIERKLKHQTYNKECEPEKVSEERERDKVAIKEESHRSMQSLINRLLMQEKIQYLDIPLADLLTFQVEGPLGSQFDSAQLVKYLDPTTTPARGSQAAQIKQSADMKNSKRGERALKEVKPIQAVSFFYISDLMDMMLEGIESTLIAISGEKTGPNTRKTSALEDASLSSQEEISSEQVEDERANYARFLENFKKFRLLLGPMEVVNFNPNGGVPESRFICMGDVAISVRYFIEWLTKKLLKKEQSIYPLPRFLNDFFNEFLRTFLNNDTCFGGITKQSTRLAQSALTAYKAEADGRDEITEAILKASAGNTGRGYSIVSSGQGVQAVASTERRLRVDKPTNTYPILSVSGQRDNAIVDPGFAKEVNYLVYFVARTYPTEKMNGDLAEDHQRGIWHYEIGKPTGIVKNISLRKTDSPGLKEVRFEQQGYDGLQQLREVYDATIDTYADVSAFPGNYIYIDPAGFSPSIGSEYDLTQLGIGGYHMITRSEHTFGPGKANSKITAKWVAELSKEGCQIPKPGDAAPSGSYEKCTLPGGKVGDQRTTAVSDMNPLSALVDSITSMFGGD